MIVASGFEPVAELLERQIADAGRGGAAVCVYHRGRPVVDVWAGARDAAGTPWTADTLAPSFSTTKGVTATALHVCVDRGLLDYDDPVARHWPEFTAAGKGAVTVRQVLCHEAGLYDISSLLDAPDDARILLDWERLIAGIEQMEPVHEPGTANAYHAVTFGHIVGELVRRVSGLSITDFVQRELAERLVLDGCHIGLPTSEHGRVATLLAPEGGPAAFGDDPSALVRLGAQLGFEVHPEMILAALPAAALDMGNGPEWLEAPIPAGNGCFTARSLARLYACLGAGGELDGVRLLSEATLARATEVQNTRPDLVIVFPMHWRLGFHGVMTTAGAPERAFGHNGYGGSGAWCDPDRGLAVAMTLNALGRDLAADDRFMAVGGAAVRAADTVRAT